MSRVKTAQGNSHLENPAFDGEQNQSDRSLDEPAVTAMAPIIACSIAIFAAEGWTPWEWLNNINPPTMANSGNGATQAA